MFRSWNRCHQNLCIAFQYWAWKKEKCVNRGPSLPLLRSDLEKKGEQENQPRAHKKKQTFAEAPSRPAGAFAMFVREQTDAVMKENPGTNAVDRLNLIQKMWQECGSPTKRPMKEKASNRFLAQLEQARIEKESLRLIQGNNLAYSRVK